MYSLYRAWLMRDAVTAGLATPPDVILLVGTESQQFLAHRQLVALHSGYLKGLLYDTTCSSVAVPNVMPEGFGPLLTFMYTGYLHLDSENIYSVLLATHLLHMPRALDICREYLVHNSATPPFPPPANIIKPIPSRKVISSSQTVWAPTTLQSPLLLRANPDGPFQSVAQTPQALPEPPITAEETPEMTAVTTSSTSSSPTISHFGKVCRKTKKINDENKESVLDVACCDGPVQFYRVLNESYATRADDGADAAARPSCGSPGTSRTTDEEPAHKLGNPHLHNRNLAQLRKALEKNVESSNNDDAYTCSYCHHSFKSHFCYEKHVRRHLHHVDKPLKYGATPADGSTSQRRQVRLLDMNVQYYPCKTCGSKFPSYYFVHKHRKLCHSGEDDVQNGLQAVETDVESNHTR